MEVYKKPCVYVKEEDISTYYPPTKELKRMENIISARKYRRIKKIAKIFSK